MASRVEGLARLKARWGKIPARLKTEVRPALEKSADELVGFQKRLVAVGGVDDEHAGRLRDSIHKEDGRHELSVAVIAGGAATKVDGYNYAFANEFGTQKVAAQPFFFPPYRSSKKRFAGRITRAMKKAIKGQ